GSVLHCPQDEKHPHHDQHRRNSKDCEDESHLRVSWNCRPLANTQCETSSGKLADIHPCGSMYPSTPLPTMGYTTRTFASHKTRPAMNAFRRYGFSHCQDIAKTR